MDAAEDVNIPVVEGLLADKLDPVGQDGGAQRLTAVERLRMDSEIKLNLYLTPDETDDVVAALKIYGQRLIKLSDKILTTGQQQYASIKGINIPQAEENSKENNQNNDIEVLNINEEEKGEIK